MFFANNTGAFTSKVVEVLPSVFISYIKSMEKLILLSQKKSIQAWSIANLLKQMIVVVHVDIHEYLKFYLFVVLTEKFEMLTFAWNKFPQSWNLLKMLNNRHWLTSKYHLEVVQEVLQTISEKRIVLLWISDAARCSGYSLCFTVSYVEHYLKQQ